MDWEKHAQIEVKTQNKAQIKFLIFDKALTEVCLKYLNYSNVLLAENIVKLSKYFGINDYAIKLKEDK